MKKINYLFFIFILVVWCTISVNAETIRINKVIENNLDYKFDILIDDITNENNINVVEGIIYYDSELIKNIEIVTSSNWEFKYKLENDKLVFISYVASDFAVNGDSLFNLNVTLNEGVNKTDVQILINDLLTNNGDKVFSFAKMAYKLMDLSDSVLSEPPEIDKGELNNKIELEKTQDSTEESEYFCETLPNETIVNQIVVKDDRQNYNGILWIVVAILLIACITQGIVIAKLIYKKETTPSENPLKKVTLKEVKEKVGNSKKKTKKISKTKEGVK